MSNKEIKQLLSLVDLEIDETYAIGVSPAVDGFMIFPKVINNLVDYIVNMCGFGTILAQNLIFVCRRRQ